VAGLSRSFSTFIRDWIGCAKRYGLIAIPAYLFDRVRICRAERADNFDARFGTDTGGLAYPWNLPSIGSWKASSEIHSYEAAPAWLIREVLATLPLQSGRFTFIDLGSGKGRTLLVASEFPFTRIVGIELSRELHLIAKANTATYRPASQLCRAFSLYCMNARDYTFEPEPLVLFVFNPFGRDTFQRVVEHLELSLRTSPRDVFVVYVNPRFASLLKSRFRKVKTGGVWWRPWHRYVVYSSSGEGPRPRK
jgi:SAM-dependent methyltransferase